MSENQTAESVQNDAAAAGQAIIDNTKAATATAAKAAKAATAKATKTAALAVKAAAAAAADASDKTAQAVADTSVATTDLVTNVADSFGPALESANAKAQEIAETLGAQTKEASLGWLDAYDAGFAAYLELRKGLAEATHLDWLTDLTESNTQALTQLNAVYSKAVRDLVK